MKARYLVHTINHTTLFVDITPVGLPNEIFPPEGKLQTLQSLPFQAWSAAEEHLSKRGARPRELHNLQESLAKSGFGMLTIV